MKTISLNGQWSLRGQRQERGGEGAVSLRAEVPGCVQLDLSREGYLPADLYMGENIKETEKYEDYEWWYETSFAYPEVRERVYIVFEGVDCIAEYYLNGERIGESDNMLVSHEFEIGKYLIEGENTLTVHILSTVIAASRAKYDVKQTMSWSNGAVETALRRAPHTYGWDIMPRAVTAGLWRDVKLEIRDRISFSQLFLYGDVKNGICKMLYELDCDYFDLDGVEIELVGECGESRFECRSEIKGRKAGRLDAWANYPVLWMPYGYGEANVYDVKARIYKDGALMHEEETCFGFRTVVLERTDVTDGVNGQFRFLINGIEVMCRGSNWVPLDAFHSRDRERYGEALALVKDIGCNILRCWGGNVYEDHEFFDFCDRNGIMVWQDFSMACRRWPENEDFKKKLYAEAEKIIRKLRNHPSIILWSGDNEVDEMTVSFADPDGNTLTREVLKKAVNLNDIGRPYLPSSPYFSGEAYRRRGEGLLPPERHLWGPRDYYKSDYYKNNTAHFVSETGYHGCPSLESIKRFITPERVWHYKDNPEWILHSSDQNGNDARVMLMENQVRVLFGDVPSDPEEYILASQISQAEAKKYFIERIRVGRPIKTGIIWWNLLDGWPQMSDAVVDYYFTKKLAYGYIKRSQALFTIAADEEREGILPIYACNDTLSEKSGHLTVRDGESDGIIFECDFTALMNASTKIAELSLSEVDGKMLFFEWSCDGERGYNHYLCAKPPISLENYKKLMKKYNL